MQVKIQNETTITMKKKITTTCAIKQNIPFKVSIVLIIAVHTAGLVVTHLWNTVWYPVHTVGESVTNFRLNVRLLEVKRLLYISKLLK